MSPGDALLWYVAFLLSTSAHEAAHALTAYQGGDPTAYRGGQVSLNPWPHIRREPFGMVVLPLLTLSQGAFAGWASTPYDPTWAQRHPRRAAWMAAAGPATNLGIALLALAALRLGLLTGVFEAPAWLGPSQLVLAEGAGIQLAGRFLSVLLTLNLWLGLLNLLPLPPLDGAAILTLFVPGDLALRLREVARGPMALGAVLVLFYLFAGQAFGGIFRLIVRLVYPDSA